MATTKTSLSHTERTAEEPRDNSLHTVKISNIKTINPRIRLYQLTPVKPPINYQPGQWLDVHCPSIPKPGGFTITSSPTNTSYIELAIQKSPQNPAAAWLWQDPALILKQELNVRVGGSFIWPPKNVKQVKRVVFVAGGVGINPLMSMVSFIAENKKNNDGLDVRFLYSSKEEKEGNILFLDRLVDVFRTLGTGGKLSLFLTSTTGGRGGEEMKIDGQTITARRRRITTSDLEEALGPVEHRAQTVCYICGVPGMTDEFIEKARKTDGMLEENVLFEKWW